MGTARLAAVAAIGQIAFVVAWAIAGAIEPGYSVSTQTVSELAATDAAHPWILWVGFACLSASDAAAGLLTLRLLDGRGRRVAAGLLFAGAVGVISIALLPLDCATNGSAACSARSEAGDVPLSRRLHSPVASITHLLLIASPFAYAYALWPRRIAAAALAAGLAGVATVVAFVAAEPGAGYGVLQRITFGSVHLWVVALAVAALAAGSRTRRA